MPTQFGKDDEGCYARWGNEGKKYYYECGNDEAKEKAKKKADRQGAAIKASQEQSPMPQQNMQQNVEVKPTLALNKGLALRTEVLDGVTYTVAPVVMITEGVHNGMLYRAEELQKFPEAWNGRTVPLLHPEDATGRAVTANSPDKIEEQAIGLLFNTKYEDGKLKAEAWINADKANALDTSVMQKILTNQMLEVSTGMLLESIQESGEWNGESYDCIATNIRPDHLAILPDREGACSIADGAGIPRINQSDGNVLDRLKSFLHSLTQEGSEKPAKHVAVCNECNSVMSSHSKSVACPSCGSVMNVRPVNNEMELGDRIDKVRQAISSANPTEEFIFIEAIYDDSVVFERDSTGELYRQEYEINDDEEVQLKGVAEQVQKNVTYEVMQSNSKTGEAKMADKTKEKVDQLIANEQSVYTEEARSFLESLEEDKLDSELEKLEEGEDTSGEQDSSNANEGEEQEGEDTSEEGVQNQKQDEEDLEARIRQAVQNELQQQEAKPLVERLAANEDCPLSKESLQALKPVELKKLAARFSINTHVRPSSVQNEGSEEEVPPMPVLEFNPS